MSNRMRVMLCEKIGSLHFRRYQCERVGVVETLTQETVVYVRPVFGLLKPAGAEPRVPGAINRNAALIAPDEKVVIGRKS